MIFYLQTIFQCQMKSLLKKIVAGPKKKTPYNGQQLDLTYITDRIIAMAFPASNFVEKTYRNSIVDVANYFNEYHKNNYLIINVSSRSYDYNNFNGRVKDYDWPDHQAPPLTTLIEISHEIKHFLEKNKKSVVAIHCNHGKGRTGTAIISFMLFAGLYNNAAQARIFYNNRRFNDDNYGVDQPCQIRYLEYVEKIKKISSIPKKIAALKLVQAIQDGLNQKYYITIKKTRTGQLLYDKFKFNGYQNSKIKPLIADIFIQIFEDTWTGAKRISRINFNTFFLNPTIIAHTNILQVKFKSNQIKLEKKSKQLSFKIKLQFEYFCLCHIDQASNCQCLQERKSEEKYWSRMIQHLRQTDYINFKENGCFEYFYNQSQNIEEKQFKQYQNQQKQQNIYGLSHNMSNLTIKNQQYLGKIIDINQNSDQENFQIPIKKEKPKVMIKYQNQKHTSSSSQDEK